MNKEKGLPEGTEVLIFKYVRGASKQDNYNYIRGKIKYFNEEGTLLYHNSTKEVQIYTVIGEDNQEYIGCYGIGLIWDYYFRTPEDQIKFLKQERQNNLDEIQKINKKNYELDKMITYLNQEELLRGYSETLKNPQAALKKIKTIKEQGK